jgi:hypothetical protein
VAILKGKSNGGQGGKLGHSNMDHWMFTEEIKEAARKHRRLEAKQQISLGLIESAASNETETEQAPSSPVTQPN